MSDVVVTQEVLVPWIGTTEQMQRFWAAYLQAA
jgi:hypothetical protein